MWCRGIDLCTLSRRHSALYPGARCSAVPPGRGGAFARFSELRALDTAGTRLQQRTKYNVSLTRGSAVTKDWERVRDTSPGDQDEIATVPTECQRGSDLTSRAGVSR